MIPVWSSHKYLYDKDYNCIYRSWDWNQLIHSCDMQWKDISNCKRYETVWEIYHYLETLLWHKNEGIKVIYHEIYIIYHQTSNISHTLVDNKCLSVLLQLHLHSQINMWLKWIGQRQMQDEMRNIYVFLFGVAYIRGLTVFIIPSYSFLLFQVIVNNICFPSSLSIKVMYKNIIKQDMIKH